MSASMSWLVRESITPKPGGGVQVKAELVFGWAVTEDGSLVIKGECREATTGGNAVARMQEIADGFNRRALKPSDPKAPQIIGNGPKKRVKPVDNDTGLLLSPVDYQKSLSTKKK